MCQSAKRSHSGSRGNMPNMTAIFPTATTTKIRRQFAASFVLWGVFVRTVLVWHITWSVNSLSHLWGYQSFQTGDFREAVECFTRAIRLRPNIAAGYRYRALAYLEMGQRTDALNDLDQAIRLVPRINEFLRQEVTRYATVVSDAGIVKE